MPDRDVVREADRAVADAERKAREAHKALLAEMGTELEEVLTSPGKFVREPPQEQDSEAGYSEKLRGALKADLLRYAGKR